MTALPRPHSPYFLIRVSKQDEIDKRTKIGSILIADTQTFMQYNTQCGEIVDTGKDAAKYFPEAKIGDTLLIHHFVQANDKNDAKENHLIHEDEKFNYYVVTAFEYGGKTNETYGVWDGEKIIPNKDYVFLKTEKNAIPGLPPDEAVNQALKKTETGLFVFNEWKESRESKEERQSELKRQAEELSKSGNNKLHIKQAIQIKEWEMEELSRDINKQTYLPYTVAYAHPQLSEWFDMEIKEGEVLGMFNMACGTIVNFMGTDFIVAKSKFIAYLYNKNKVA